MARIRLLKDYPLADAKAGAVVDATYEPWDESADHAYTKRRAVGRGVWKVQWTERFSTSFVDGLDAIRHEPAEAVFTFGRTNGRGVAGVKPAKPIGGRHL